MFPLDIENTYQPDAAVVAAQNDMFRKAQCLGISPDIALAGRAVATHAVNIEGEDFIKRAVLAVGLYDLFEPENDPDGYRDFGVFEIDGKRLYFKIDLFEAGSKMRYGAETPDNPDTTERLLTIMLASDW